MSRGLVRLPLRFAWKHLGRFKRFRVYKMSMSYGGLGFTGFNVTLPRRIMQRQQAGSKEGCPFEVGRGWMPVRR